MYDYKKNTLQSMEHNLQGSRGNTKAMTRMIGNAELIMVKQGINAWITKEALDYVTFLSAAEAECQRRAPGGKDDYRILVRSFTLRAAADIMEGGDYRD